MAKMCVYFNSELLYIERPFHETRVFKWYEIQKIKGKYGSTIHLYHLDGTKILTVYAKIKITGVVGDTSRFVEAQRRKSK